MNLGGSVVTCSVYMYYKVSANELKVVSLRSVVTCEISAVIYELGWVSGDM